MKVDKYIKKIIAFTLSIFLIMGIVPFTSLNVEAAGSMTKCSRDDGVWLFPLDSKYWNTFSDYGGCAGTGACLICGRKHDGSHSMTVGGKTYKDNWGDSAHNTYPNYGVDIAAPSGSSVYAARGGYVYFHTSMNSGRGIYAIVEHPIANSNYSYYSLYQHLSKVNNGVHKNGSWVDTRDVIGSVGGSGTSANQYGAHLHFEVFIGEKGGGQALVNSLVDSQTAKYYTNPKTSGYLKTSGIKKGAIITNPKNSNNPGGYSGVGGPCGSVTWEYHKGSITYTFDKNQVPSSSDTTAPKITNQKVTSIDASGATIECDVTDNVKVKSVRCTVWSDVQGIDTYQWIEPKSISGNHYTFRMEVKNFGNQRGLYHTNVFAWDSSDNQTMEHINPNYTIPNQLVTGISFDKNSMTLNVNVTQTLKATVNPSDVNNKTLTWSSSNTSVATVDSSGKVTAKSAGTATITAKANDGSGKSATCTVTVKQPATGITLNTSNITLNVNASQTLSATVSPSNTSNKSIAWSSSNTSIATVDSNGKVTAKSAGTTTITAKVNDGSGISSKCTITVVAPSKESYSDSNSNTNSNGGNTTNSNNSNVTNPENNSSVTNPNNSNAAYVSMYRLYNPNSGEHFYTGNISERDNLVKIGWKYEGVAWKAPKYSNTPVYRLYNPNSGDHHYTVSVAEKNFLVKSGWRFEGVGWYSAGSDGQALYRMYNPYAKGAGSHHYTTSAAERDYLKKIGWRYEGIAWYGGR